MPRAWQESSLKLGVAEGRLIAPVAGGDHVVELLPLKSSRFQAIIQRLFRGLFIEGPAPADALGYYPVTALFSPEHHDLGIDRADIDACR